MMNEGLVTTIIPVWNRPRELAEAVQSVLDQDWRPIEIVIVDDGSTDETLDAARAIEARHPGIVRVLTQSHAGPGAAREAGRSAATGEYIQYLDSDDVLLPGKFSAQVAALRKNPDCGVAYGLDRSVTHDGQIIVSPQMEAMVHSRPEAIFPAFLADRLWGTATPLYRRSVCDRAGPWLNTSIDEDYEYECRIGSFGTRLAFVDQYVCEFRDSQTGRLSYRRLDPALLSQRAQCWGLVLQHARRAGIENSAPEMRHFARKLFRWSRFCAAAGLVTQSKLLFELTRDASGQDRKAYLTAYRLASSVLGWTRVAKLIERNAVRRCLVQLRLVRTAAS